MMKTYEETFPILTSNCDMKGTWRLSAVLESMQEAAGAHSLLLGCGREELLKKNIVWVLSRSELHMNRYPRAGEKITLHTFPMPKQMQPQTQLSITTHSGKTPRARISTLRAAVSSNSVTPTTGTACITKVLRHMRRSLPARTATLRLCLYHAIHQRTSLTGNLRMMC